MLSTWVDFYPSCSRVTKSIRTQTVGCVAWRLTDNHARLARPLHGSQAQMLMLLELLLELLLLLLMYVFDHVLLRGREAPP